LFVSLQNIYKVYPFPFSWIELYNLRNADYAVAASEEIRDVLVRKGFDKDRLLVIPYGVDHLIYRRVEMPELKSKLRLDNLLLDI
jgi:glycosyltransferase involved in cell wall biosynthesis